MKQSDKRQQLHYFIQQQQQGIQRKFEEFRSQYEHSGKTSFLLAQTECQGAVAAYQDLLRMYDMHITYDEQAPAATVKQPVQNSHLRTLTTLYTYCRQKHQDAEQKISRCQQQYDGSGDNKYLFLKRKYAGEVIAYQNVGQYIHTLEPPTAVPEEVLPPLSAAEPKKKAHHNAEKVSGLFHILVMDSSSLVRKSIDMILSSEGFTVTAASDGVVGFDIAKKVSPDLILMDSNIARRSEEQLIVLLRREKALRRIPLILLEGTGRSLDERVSRQMGIVASIQKPFQPEELLHTIQAALSE
jgi:CheY-like chemotaxis protein